MPTCRISGAHDDLPINCVGYINDTGYDERWDEIAIDGNIAARDRRLRYRGNGRTLAAASATRAAYALARATCERLPGSYSWSNSR